MTAANLWQCPANPISLPGHTSLIGSVTHTDAQMCSSMHVSLISSLHVVIVQFSLLFGHHLMGDVSSAKDALRRGGEEDSSLFFVSFCSINRRKKESRSPQKRVSSRTSLHCAPPSSHTRDERPNAKTVLSDRDCLIQKYR